jgi:hypothetical protein
VKKEDLRQVWQDIGMPSGHAYAKALRTGEDLRRQRVVPLRHAGLDADGQGPRARAVAHVRAAQGQARGQRLPAQLRRAGIKDVGVIGVDSGWEIYVAGNGGIKTEVAQFFVKLKTAEEVLEYSGAFLQLYREEGWYLERTVHYVSRVGLDYVKKKILDDHAGRKALWERLQFALDGEPDPWFEFDKATVDTRQFDPVGAVRMSDWKPSAASRTSRCSARAASRAAGCDVAVFRNAEDKVFALLDRCPHKGGRCARASCSARAWPARCTTGPSAWPTAAPRRPTKAARRVQRARSSTAVSPRLDELNSLALTRRIPAA